MEPQSGIKTWQWVVTVLVIIVLVVIGVMVFKDKGETENTLTPEETPAVVDNNTAINRIVMSDQYPGNVVYLSSVQVGANSWVVIHEDSSGLPGKVIGSARFAAGINPGKITLTKPMVDGGTYYAVIYNDIAGASFDITKNTPVKDANGKTIMKVFKSSASVGVDFKG